MLSTGLSGGHDAHCVNDSPEHVAQSGWHDTQEPPEEKVVEGQEVLHESWNASWLFVQVRQKVAEPAQVPQVESQAGRGR